MFMNISCKEKYRLGSQNFWKTDLKKLEESLSIKSQVPGNTWDTQHNSTLNCLHFLAHNRPMNPGALLSVSLSGLSSGVLFLQKSLLSWISTPTELRVSLPQ